MVGIVMVEKVRLFADQNCQSVTTENAFPGFKDITFQEFLVLFDCFGCLITRSVTWHNLFYVIVQVKRQTVNLRDKMYIPIMFNPINL